MPICPRCGMSTGAIYKCDNCGDVRCNGNTIRGNQGACATSKAPGGKPEPASPNRICRVCRKGRYHKI